MAGHYTKSAKISSMNTFTPPAFVSDLLGAAADTVSSMRPPPWMQQAVQQRLVLLLNHVLQQNQPAQERLLSQKGKTVRVSWQQFSLRLQITPAGLFALLPDAADADLSLTLQEKWPLQILQRATLGERPTVHIAGDAQLAEQINWLVANVRWNVQAELAAILGETPAHYLALVAQHLAHALRCFVERMVPSSAIVGGKQPAG